MTGMSQGGSNAGSKKIRMTMACERCRSKKVKCDFAHPACSRCQQANATCSYDGSPTQIDLFNLVKLNETVDVLQERIHSIESSMKDISSNTGYVADRLRSASGAHSGSSSSHPLPTNVTTVSTSDAPILSTLNSNNHDISGLLSIANSDWSLSLTPRGLRIDTNIISLHELYDILQSGLSRLSLGNDDDGDQPHSSPSSRSSSASSPQLSSGRSGLDTRSVDKATVIKKKPFWKSRLKVFPLYSSWNSSPSSDSSAIQIDTLPKEILDHMIDIYVGCFLALPCPDTHGSILARYRKGTLDPLLANTVFAWSARHGAIYHDLFPGKDPNLVGQAFFERAKLLLRERFLLTDVDTMHSLLIMYLYALGEQKSQSESEAYMYLGLAHRMCLDLKMHAESSSQDPAVQELNRRFFGVLSFLETLCTVHSDKPYSLPFPELITVGYPTVMDHEVGEDYFKVDFMIQRYRITSIYRDIINKTAQETPLLSTISALDKNLKDWYTQLPPHFKYTQGDIHTRNWKSTSFREQACLKLNFEYNFELCQLYSLFFSRPSGDEPPSAIDLLSREVCLRAADTTVELLDCWIQLQQRWCHFAIETLISATMVYGTLLTRGTDPEKAQSTMNNLKRMAKALVSSPVKHHLHVVALIERIRDMLSEYTHESPEAIMEEIGKVMPVLPDVKIESSEQVPREMYTSAGTMSSQSISDMASPTTLSLQRTHTVPSHSHRISPNPTGNSNDPGGGIQLADFLYTPTLMRFSPQLNPTRLDGTMQGVVLSPSYPHSPVPNAPHRMTFGNPSPVICPPQSLDPVMSYPSPWTASHSPVQPASVNVGPVMYNQATRPPMHDPSHGHDKPTMTSQTPVTLGTMENGMLYDIDNTFKDTRGDPYDRNGYGYL